MFRYIALVWIIFAGKDLQAHDHSKNYSWINEAVWPKVRPYLLPDDHPAKQPLEEIFGTKRVTASLETMKLAGFRMHPMRNKRKVIAKHPAMPGYLIKTYLDCHSIGTEDWKLWKHRIKGAKCVQASLDKHGCNHLMKVPKKWLYPIPFPPLENAGVNKENRQFILVVEDMQPLLGAKNKKQFKKMTAEYLDALYIILKENLLHDSIYVHNIPFCKDGKLAFLDLEHHNSTSRRVRYERLTPYFSIPMQHYWQTLIKN